MSKLTALQITTFVYIRFEHRMKYTTWWLLTVFKCLNWTLQILLCIHSRHSFGNGNHKCKHWIQRDPDHGRRSGQHKLCFYGRAYMNTEKTTALSYLQHVQCSCREPYRHWWITLRLKKKSGALMSCLAFWVIGRIWWFCFVQLRVFFSNSL